MKRKKGLPTYPGSKKIYVSLGFLSILEAIASIAQAIFLARAITFLFQGAAVQTIVWDLCFFFIAFLGKRIITIFQQKVAEYFARESGKTLRKQLLKRYFHNGRAFVQQLGTGRLVTLVVEGINDLKEYLTIAIPRMIRTAIIPTLIVIYIFTLDVKSAIILIITVPIVVIFMILLGLAAEKKADSQYETYRILSNHFIDSLKGLDTLTYLGQSKQQEENISRVSEQYRKATIDTLKIAFLSSFALDFFTSLSIAFVAVGLGFRLIDGTTTLLPALTILILAPEYFLPIRQVGKDYHATLDGQVAMEEIDTMLTEKKTSEQAKVPLPWKPSHNQLELKDVTLETDGEKRLEAINFSHTGNGMIGIVGASGAGKSTLIHVLAGFLQPTKGSVLINGQPLHTVHPDEWMEKIAYLPQHPYIFPLSLADNIRFYEPNASDDEVAEVIDKIGLASFVHELPKGMHEPIGEGARTLSGGQEQRIAMARALLSKKPILLLDEPTAHLDIETEYDIKQLMIHIFQEKLVFFATHRYHWMKEMDGLLVLDQGKLRTQGTHDELIQEDTAYKQLVKGDG